MRFNTTCPGKFIKHCMGSGATGGKPEIFVGTPLQPPPPKKKQPLEFAFREKVLPAPLESIAPTPKNV